MIPELRISPVQIASLQPRVVMGLSNCPILHSENSDLNFTQKPCRDNKYCYPTEKKDDFKGGCTDLKNTSCECTVENVCVSNCNVSSHDRSNSLNKVSSIGYRRTGRSLSMNTHRPAEVFRKDLISAMKIPDTASLPTEEYWIMQDSWRMEWEKGVQVPVHYEAIPEISIRKLSKELYKDFKLPRKMFKIKPKPGDKMAIDLCQAADSVCRYDLDELDVFWLEELNKQRILMGMDLLDEYSMEQIMESLENQGFDNLQHSVDTKQGLGIQYDEDVVCDVCRQPDSEDDNEMVFCDGCNVCVHQACYGILKIPDGSWLCKPCTLGVREMIECIFCGKKGGAMKSTRSGQTWAHVICALWIPEISFGDANRMEPITKVSQVPAPRWALLCSLCKERVGACIQCSIKQCVTAYHVTCAVEAKLEMSTEFDSSGENCDSVIFKSFCKKHSKSLMGTVESEKNPKSVSSIKKQHQNQSTELNDEFYSAIDLPTIEASLGMSSETVSQVAAYWRLKRRANFNKPLMIAKNDETTSVAEAAETNLKRRLRLFTHIRQDLERVRNLCYMVCRREKMKLAGTKNMENVFLTQMKSLEYRMKLGYHTPRMVSMLQKSGNNDVCEVSRQESCFLSKSKYWRPEDTSAPKLPKPFLKMTRKRSPKATKNDRTLSVSSDDSIVSFGSFSSDDEVKQKQRLTLESNLKPTETLIVKRKRGRPPLNKTSQVKQKAPTAVLSKKRSSSMCFDSETENRKPAGEITDSKRTRSSRGHLYKANFSLTDRLIRTRRVHSRVLSDSSPLNNSVKLKSQNDSASTESSKVKKVQCHQSEKKSSRVYRGISNVKRQFRLRRRSSPSYISAKHYHCYVLY